MLSMSTSWMPEPEKGIKYWLEQVKALGIDAVELSYKVDQNQLNEFEDCLGELSMGVSSIHNFCPTPDDEKSPRHPSNYYRLSSKDEHERQQAIKWTNIAVDTAKRTGAGVVVIHAGTLDFEDERSPELFRLYCEGKRESEEFLAERTRILDLRQKKQGIYIDSLVKSLFDVIKYAQSKDVKIGLETRYYPIEIPNFEEIGMFLDMFREEGLRYWHDVGHAEMNSRLGITEHKKFLDTYKDDLIGVHLHGIKERRDHLAPFEGDMDLDDLLPYFGAGVIRVIESKPFASFDLLKDAVKKLK